MTGSQALTANKALQKAGLNIFNWTFVLCSTVVILFNLCAKSATSPSRVYPWWQFKQDNAIALGAAIQKGLDSPRVEDFDFKENLKPLKAETRKNG